MKYIRSIIISLLFLSLQMVLPDTLGATNTLVTDIRVTDNDTTFRYVYLYSNGYKMLETCYYKQGTDWVRHRQTEWVYDAGLCSSQIERVFKNNTWQRNFQIDYSYSNGLPQTETYQKVDANVMFPLQQIVYNYSNSLLASRKEYSFKNNDWVPAFYQEYHYNSTLPDTITNTLFVADTISEQTKYQNSYYSSGKLKEQTGFVLKNNTWKKQQLSSWFYRGSSDDVLSLRMKVWNDTTEKWENYQKTDYEYNTTNQLVAETNQYWKSVYWTSNLKYIYSYDSQGRLVSKTMQSPLYNAWRSLTSIAYSEFTLNNPSLMESRYEFWGGTTGEAVSSYIPFVLNDETVIRKAKTIELVYAEADTTQAVHNITDDTHLISVYPNPSDGIFYVDVQSYGVSSWAIADLSGRILKQSTQGGNSGVIDISEFPTGVYLLRAITPNKVLTQKLVKQ